MIRTTDAGDIRRKIIKDVSKRYDDFIFKQFEKHGFSREDVHKAILENLRNQMQSLLIIFYQ